MTLTLEGCRMLEMEVYGLWREAVLDYRPLLYQVAIGCNPVLFEH